MLVADIEGTQRRKANEERVTLERDRLCMEKKRFEREEELFRESQDIAKSRLMPDEKKAELEIEERMHMKGALSSIASFISNISEKDTNQIK